MVMAVAVALVLLVPLELDQMLGRVDKVFGPILLEHLHKEQAAVVAVRMLVDL